MRKFSSSCVDAGRELIALAAATLMLGMSSGCSKPVGQQKAVQSGPGGTEVKSEAPADSTLPVARKPDAAESSGRDVAWGESETDSPYNVVVHHHYYFGFGANDSSGRLSAAQYDRSIRVIHWPPLLRQKQFSEVRYQLDKLFDQRDPSNSGLGSKNYEETKRQCEGLLGILAGMTDQLNSTEFVEAARFVKGLEEESRFPVE
jgi:hypothetical protein